ncbi:MAG: lysophospholipid acyltransferase family protein [Bacteroidota bacterium]
MQGILYYLALPMIYIISLLPFRVLYLLSDGMYLFIYKLLGYRKKVVGENLRKSFPEKTEQEIQQIQSQFYRYFCDLILETLKTLTIQPKVLMKRVTFENGQVYEQFLKKNQSVIVVMGHLGNWELGGARFSQTGYHQLYVIFHPLANKYFDKLLYHMRIRLGNKLYSMKETFKGMIKNRKEVTATAFIADQTPQPQDAYWTTFLNQETPVFRGTAKIARKLKYPIIYVSIHRIKRGYYQVNNELLLEDPTQLSEDEISELHTRRLESDIVESPAFWLWTHRRWKHKKPNSN